MDEEGCGEEFCAGGGYAGGLIIIHRTEPEVFQKSKPQRLKPHFSRTLWHG